MEREPIYPFRFIIIRRLLRHSLIVEEGVYRLLCLPNPSFYQT